MACDGSFMGQKRGDLGLGWVRFCYKTAFLGHELGKMGSFRKNSFFTSRPFLISPLPHGRGSVKVRSLTVVSRFTVTALCAQRWRSRSLQRRTRRADRRMSGRKRSGGTTGHRRFVHGGVPRRSRPSGRGICGQRQQARSSPQSAQPHNTGPLSRWTVRITRIKDPSRDPLIARVLSNPGSHRAQRIPER